MTTPSSRRLAALAGLVLTLCLCIGVGVPSVGLLLSRARAVRPTLEAEPAASQPPTAATEVDPPSAAIPPQIGRQMDEIQAQVIQLRGLQPEGPVHRELLTPEQLRIRVLEDFLQDYTPEEAEDDARTLVAFGLLAPGFDLLTFYQELLSEQIAGFYDQETKEMVVIQGEDFGGPERLVYAHEYAHVLQDQTYNLEDGLGYSDERCEEDTESCAAIQALIEGDATLIELNWFQDYATGSDQRQILEFTRSLEQPTFESAPAFLQEDFLFPYLQGLAFVQALFNQDGWAAIDRAYEDPPVSTEQILHPERYPADLPVPVSIPDLGAVLGESWELVDEGVLGEWYTFLILAKGIHMQLEDTTAQAASEGWDGDAYAVYSSEQGAGIALVLITQWESEMEATQFAEAFDRYATGRFGERVDEAAGRTAWQTSESYAEFSTQGSRTTWILAPDPALAQGIQEVIAGD